MVRRVRAIEEGPDRVVTSLGHRWPWRRVQERIVSCYRQGRCNAQLHWKCYDKRFKSNRVSSISGCGDRRLHGHEQGHYSKGIIDHALSRRRLTEETIRIGQGYRSGRLTFERCEMHNTRLASVFKSSECDMSVQFPFRDISYLGRTSSFTSSDWSSKTIV